MRGLSNLPQANKKLDAGTAAALIPTVGQKRIRMVYNCQTDYIVELVAD